MSVYDDRRNHCHKCWPYQVGRCAMDWIWDDIVFGEGHVDKYFAHGVRYRVRSVAVEYVYGSVLVLHEVSVKEHTTNGLPCSLATTLLMQYVANSSEIRTRT